MLKCHLNPDRFEAWTSNLGRLLLCLTILTARKFFLMPSLNLLCCSSVHSLALSSLTRQQRPASPSTLPLLRELQRATGSSSPEWTVQCPQPLLTGDAFQTFYQLCCHSLHVFEYLNILCYCGHLNCMQYSRCSSSNAKYSRRTNSFNWLPVLYSTHSKLHFAFLASRAHCFLTLSYCWVALQPLIF